MAGGPIYPHSAYPVTAVYTFPVLLTAEMPQAHGFAASLAGNATWRLFFRCPPTLPTGTGKLLLTCHANATSGNAIIDVAWKSYAANEVPASASLNAEGDATITFATTAYRETQSKITLDADTLVGGELVMLELRAKTSGWTLAATLAVVACMIWE